MRINNFLLPTLLLLPLLAGAEGYPRDRCQLPADQGVGSFLGAWENLPIKLVLDEEFYSMRGGKDAEAIKRAVNTWNEWAKLKGKVAFIIENDGKGMPIPKIDGCVQAAYTAAVPGAVGIWKITNSGDRANRRPSCGSNQDGTFNKILFDRVTGQTDWAMPGGKIAGASILLNFADYLSGRYPKMDLESVALHELGHVLGLLHSCNGSHEGAVDGTSAPICAEAPEAYSDAVMYPITELKVRRKLRQNDYARINCLY